MNGLLVIATQINAGDFMSEDGEIAEWKNDVEAALDWIYRMNQTRNANQ
jgi:hypothetical protein